MELVSYHEKGLTKIA